MKKLFLLLVAGVVFTSCYKDETIIIIGEDEVQVDGNGYAYDQNPANGNGGNEVGFRLVPSDKESAKINGEPSLMFAPYVEKGAALVNSAGRNNVESDFPLNFYNVADADLTFFKSGAPRYTYADINYQTNFVAPYRTFDMVPGVYSYSGTAGDLTLLRSGYLPFTLLTDRTFTVPVTGVQDLYARTPHSIVTVNDASSNNAFGTPSISVGSAPLAEITDQKVWNGLGGGATVDYAYVLSGNSFELSVPWSVTVSDVLYSGVATRTISTLASYTHYAYNLNIEVTILQAGQVQFRIVFENPFTLRTEEVNVRQTIDPTDNSLPYSSIDDLPYTLQRNGLTFNFDAATLTAIGVAQANLQNLLVTIRGVHTNINAYIATFTTGGTTYYVVVERSSTGHYVMISGTQLYTDLDAAFTAYGAAYADYQANN